MARRSESRDPASEVQVVAGFAGKPIGVNALITRMTKPGAAPGFAEHAAAFTTFQSLEKGVSAAWVRSLETQGLTRADIRRIIPDRTLDRRIAKGENLKIEEADGLARLLRVVRAARDLFENDENADGWLRNPIPSLGDRIPIEMAQTDLGAREVEAVLGRLAHGVY